LEGYAEQNPNVFWKAVCEACLFIWQGDPRLRERIAGVALTTQRSTLINVDKTGNPLRPAIVWLDKRRTPGLKPLGGLWGFAFRLVGMTGTVAYLQSEAEANWINRYQPEIWEKTDKFLYLSGYLTYKLTGRFVDSIGCQVGYMPFDYKKLGWASNFDWKWQVLPIHREQLVDLVPPTKVLGEITQDASIQTGIPCSLPLIAAAADKACEVLGTGSLEPHIACISYGTTATINTNHTRYHEIIPLIPPYPAAVPGAYSMECQVYRGYWMVSWFKNEFGQPEISKSNQSGKEPESYFEELLNEVPPGSDGLILQPFWSPGLKKPGPEARGAIIGFTDIHTRAHIYRAILEGIAYALREGAELTARHCHQPIHELRIAGGGSQSNGAMQITADVFGLPASRSKYYDASGLGAAIDAAVGLGFYPDFSSAVKEMTQVGDSFEPNLSIHNLYDEIFQNVYLKMYNRLKPAYIDLQRFMSSPK
jgi:sugar (pentulose or hexulose) kinase